MANVSIERASKDYTLGGRVNYLAIGDMCEAFLGTSEKHKIEYLMQQLWKKPGNRFSHEYSLVAKKGDNVTGIVTCYPVSKMDATMGQTVLQILKLKGLGAISLLVQNFKSIKSLITMKEGYKGEYHVSMLAVLPEHQGTGSGTALLKATEDYALNEGFDTCSLTVKKDNHEARKLYEKMGYKIVGDIDKAPFHLYRMRKQLV
ncbi:GNAT family N-acetyltransferase [Staphylococcus massiliensis]|uniref:N-acetyltransferase domain-containing protein n=1 Tax=Staphylococcus massiliensis S46 TaxID=1229783 RepID=K9AS06_9STAP|nr:GNAT family N-acetyltransferase [Staphylococcus massiliensis]EKU50099.1 hypothetical protein C273_02483 [Staphylococcus massiliensis S46]MCG3402196.1 GNAT family N-acetyltransferase [Staphylococcus massiliensis]MCG3412837.1 GNAT family N-acetyltransferase [Staphylococcus massiliensis]PNZ97455.1 GNAT family N-acetyltransferase [Staphylococcus massiliensis CCUG 55927]